MPRTERGSRNPPQKTTRQVAEESGSMPTFRGGKPSKEMQERISAKIAKLRRGGKSGDAAAGAAYGMAREGRLGPHGGYKKKGD